MASLTSQILLNIQAVVTGQAGVQQLSGSIGGLTAQLVGLNAGMQVVGQVVQGVQQLTGQMTAWADAANKAATDTRVFELTLNRFGVSVDGANGAAQRLATKFGVSVEDIQGSMTTLIRAGFRDMGQLEEVMTGAAASSIAFGRSAADGFDRLGDAAVTGLSAALNAIGIAENLGPAFDQAARSLGKTADALTEAERTQVLYNLVVKATKTEVDALGSIQNEYVRSQQAADLAQKDFAKTMGTLVMPGVIRFNQASAEGIRVVTTLAQAYRDGGDVLGELAKKYPALASALESVRPALAQGRALLTDLGQTGRQIFDQTLLPLFRALAPQAQAMVAAIAPQFARFIAVARDIASTVREAFERVIVPLLRAVAPVVMQVVATVVPLLAQFAEAFAAYFQLVVTAWERIAVPVIRTIAPVVQTAVRLVGDVLGGAITLVKGIFNAVRALIAGDWTGAWNIARDAVGTALLKIQDVLAELLPRVWKVITDLAAGVGARAKTVGLNIKDGIIAGMAGLSAELATRIDEAVRTMTDRIPPWLRDRLGLTAAEAQRQAAIQTIQDQGTAAEGRITERTQASTQQAVRRAGEALPENSFSLSVWQQSFMARNDQKADFVVDYCLRWVRDTLGDASPKMRAQIDALLQANPEKFTDKDGKTGYVPTARSAYKNLQAAGLARDYSTTADLTPGDTVFYTENGQNHTGIYIGAGQVRGNNRVSFKESGGTNPVGTVGINQLGSVTGYVRLQDLEAYLRKGTPATSQPKVTTTAPDVKLPAGAPPPAPTPTATTDGPLTAAQITKAQQLLAALDQAKKALEADPKNAGLTVALDAADQAVKRWTKDNEGNARALSAVQAGLGGVKKASDTYIASAADLKKYGTEALLLIKEQERAAQSGNAAEIERVRGKVAAFQEGGKAQAAVLAAEQAAYQGRQQQADQDAQKTRAREKEQRDLRAQIASEQRTLTVSAAQQTLDRLQTLDAQELAAFKGTAAERLKIIQRQSQDEYTARMKVAQAQRDAALRESANTGGPNQGERDRQIRATYEQTRLEQQGVRLETVRQATAAVAEAQEAYTAALDEGTRAGNEALAGLDRAALGGRELAATAQTLIPAQKTFDALQVRIEALRADLSTPGVAEAWIASIEDMGRAGRLTAEQITDLRQQITTLATAEQTAYTSQRAFDVETLGNRTDAGLVTLYNKARAERDTDLMQRVLAEQERRTLATNARLNASAEEASTERIRLIHEEAQAEQDVADDAGITTESLTAMLAELTSQGRDPQETGFIQWLDEVIARGGNAAEVARTFKADWQAAAEAERTYLDTMLEFGGASQNVVQPRTPRGARDEAGQVLPAEPELTFLTDDQVRGIGVKTDTIGNDFYDLENVIQNVMGMSRDEMTALMVTAGLTAAQIATVTAAWEEFHQVADLPVAGIEARFEGWATKVDALVADLQDGAISQEDFNRQALDAIPALERLAQAADAQGYAELAGYYRAAASGLGELATGAGTVTQTLSTAEQQAADTTVSLLDLTGRYREGATSQQDFVTAALAALGSLEAQAHAAERVGNSELAAYYRQLAAELRELGGAALKTAQGLQTFNEYAGYVQQLAGAFGKLAGATGNGDLEANFNGIANAAGQAIALAGDVARILANPADIGAWVGAITKIVSGIADAVAGFQRAREEARKLREDFQAGFKFIDASTFSSFTTRSRGFFADLFGGGPEVVKQINETAATVARAIESGVTGGFTRGITNFLNGTGTLLDGIRDGIRGAIIDAITQAVIQGAIIKGTLGGLLTELTTTLAGGGDATGVITRIGAALPGVAQQLEATLTPLRRTIDAALPASSPSSGGSSPALASGGSTIQTGTPTVVIDVLREARDLLRSANDTGRLLIEAARKIDGAVNRFSAAVDRFSGPHASSTAGAR